MLYFKQVCLECGPWIRTQDKLATIYND